MEDLKLSGWNMKRFHKRRQVVVTQDIKAFSLPQDQSLHLALPAFSSCAYLQTHLLWHIVSTHIYLTLRCRLEDCEGKCCNFKDENVRGWILDLFLSVPSFRSLMYTSLPFCIVCCLKNRRAICLPRQPSTLLVMPAFCVLRWLTRDQSTSCLLLF